MVDVMHMLKPAVWALSGTFLVTWIGVSVLGLLIWAVRWLRPFERMNQLGALVMAVGKHASVRKAWRWLTGGDRG